MSRRRISLSLSNESVVSKAPKLLHQAVVYFPLPLSLEKCLIASWLAEEFSSIPPIQSPRYSSVYACVTISGSRLFQTFSAALTLARAVSSVKGGAIASRLMRCD
jgi:hypothetical protein